MPTSRPMPYGNFNFRVEISGVEAGYFKGVDGLSAELETIERAQRIPGMHKVGDVTLKRGVVGSSPRSLPGSITLYDLTPTNAVGAKLLDDWRRATPAHGAGPRKPIVLRVYDKSRRLLGSWNFSSAYPTAWKGPATTTTQSHNGVAIEEVVIAHEGFERRQ